MSWLADIRKRRQLRKAVAEAVVVNSLHGHRFSEDEFRMLIFPNVRWPLGDSFATEYFLKDRSRRMLYILYLARLIEECGKCLSERESYNAPEESIIKDASPKEIVDALDPLLEYCLNRLQIVFDHPNGPGSMGRHAIRAFQKLPRHLCGQKAKRKISEVDGDKNIHSFMMISKKD